MLRQRLMVTGDDGQKESVFFTSKRSVLGWFPLYSGVLRTKSRGTSRLWQVFWQEI